MIASKLISFRKRKERREGRGRISFRIWLCVLRAQTK